MQDLPLSQVEHWSTEYLGLPWRSGARGPREFDCYGLVWWIYLKRLNVKLPLYPGIAAIDSRAVARTIKRETEPDFLGHSNWLPLAKPVEFSVATMAQDFRFTHVGIYTETDGGFILHTAEAKTVVASRPANLLKSTYKRIKFYKYNGSYS